MLCQVIYWSLFTLVYSAEQPPSDLSKKPVYERQLKGEDAVRASELKGKRNSALNTEQFDQAKKLATELLELRTRLQGADHWEVTDAQLSVRHIEIVSKLDASNRKELAETYRLNQRLGEEYRKGDYKKAATIGETVLATRRKLLGENHPDYVLSLDSIAILYKSKGEFAKAEPVYRQVLQLREKLQGKYHPDYAISLDNLAIFYKTISEYEKAEALYRQSADLRQQLFGEIHAEYAHSLSNLAELYRSLGQHAKAQPLAIRALDLRRMLLGEKHPDYVISLNNLAALYMSMDDYAKAEPLYRQAAELHRKLHGENHPLYALSLNNLAELFRKKGDYEKAEPLALAAVELRRKILGPDHLQYALSLNNLAALYEEMGKYTKAEPLIRQAVELCRKLFGEHHPEYASRLSNLADLYRSMGEYEKAESLTFQALEIRRKFLGENHPDYAISLNNLAHLYETMGEYAKAEPLYRQATEIFRKLLGENHSHYATSLNNLADHFDTLGDYAKAESLYHQAAEIRRKVAGENHPDYAVSLNNLGSFYSSQGEYLKAEPYYRQALEIRRSILKGNHPVHATILGNLGSMYKSMGENAKAELYTQQAADLFRQLLGENHPDYAIKLNNLAELYRSMGKYTQAEPLAIRSQELRRKFLGENHPEYAISLTNLAVLYHGLREFSKAEGLLKQCVSSYEMCRLTRAKGLDRALGGAGHNPYPLLAAISARLGLPRAGYDAIEHDMARALLDEQAARRGQTLSQDQRMKQQDIVSQLARIEPRIVKLANQAKSSDAEKQELEDLIKDRRKLTIGLAALAADLSQKNISNIHSIQSSLNPDQAIISWVDVAAEGVHEHWVCIVRHEGDPKWKRLPGSSPMGEWTPEDLLLPMKFLFAITGDATTAPASPAEVNTIAERLYAQRIAPVEKHLSGVKTLYVVGIQSMAGIPIEAITDRFTISYIPSGTFLARIKKVPMPTGSRLLALGDPYFPKDKTDRDTPQPLPPGGVLISQVIPGGAAAMAQLQVDDVLLRYGNAELKSVEDLGKAIAAQNPAQPVVLKVWRSGRISEREVKPGKLGVLLAREAAPESLAAKRKSDQLLASLNRSEKRADLPGTRVELDCLKVLFGMKGNSILADVEATEEALDALREKDLLKQYRYLHIATHGEANNALAFESRLILAQHQKKELSVTRVNAPYLDGLLSAREVLDFWKLDAELVTLSACETALGRPGGGDGLLGFAQAFLTAGSRAVCLSLWKVDDSATALLMDRFYSNLLGKREGLKTSMGKAAALAEAKLWLRKLSVTEASSRLGALTNGVARGKGQAALPSIATPLIKPDEKSNYPYAHPRFWAGFVLIGDPN